MLATIVLLVIAGGLIAIGYEWGQVKAYSEFSERDSEKEESWWKEQAEKLSDELKSEKNALKDAICRNDDLWKQNKALINENEALTNQVNGYLARFGELKLTIEQKHQEEIVQYFKEGLTLDQIAEKIGCGRSTISRAIKKRGLTR